MDKILKDSLALRNFLDSLSRGGKTYAIDRIVEGCLVPRRTVYNWVYGLCRIPALHRAKIEEIFEKKIFQTEEICTN